LDQGCKPDLLERKKGETSDFKIKREKKLEKCGQRLKESMRGDTTKNQFRNLSIPKNGKRTHHAGKVRKLNKLSPGRGKMKASAVKGPRGKDKTKQKRKKKSGK